MTDKPFNFQKRLSEARQKNHMILFDGQSNAGRETNRECVECGLEVEGDVMVPEVEGPMHTDCWAEWMEEQ